jgi:hypothetical protein
MKDDRGVAWMVAAVASWLLVCAGPASGQVRGLPVFLEPAYAADWRIGADAADGGEAQALTLVASAARRFRSGACPRLFISAAGGIRNPPGGDFETDFAGGIGAQLLLDRCPEPTTVFTHPTSLVAGLGVVRAGGRSAVNIPIGVGRSLRLLVAGVHIEPWIVPHLLYAERMAGPSGGFWSGAVAAGLHFGSIAFLRGGILRFGTQCCREGVAFSYGLSFWQ